jgi:hypothetical protein
MQSNLCCFEIYLRHFFAREQDEIRMYKSRHRIQARSLFVTTSLILTLVWLLGVFAPAVLAVKEYIPPDVGLPDRRESGGARFLIERQPIDFWQDTLGSLH